MNKKIKEKHKRNLEKAKAKYKNAWWDSDDSEILFLGQIQERILMMKFDKFQKATEEVLGRSVWTHEFAQPKDLLDDFLKTKPKATMNDIMNKLTEYGKPIIVVKNDRSNL